MDFVSLIDGVTPVQRLDRFAESIGLGPGDLWVKRDDLIGLGGGGNKVRKLQYSLGEALAAGADVVVTTGAQQSNHARLTAAAGAKLGLVVVLVLEGDAPKVPSGNLVLEDLFGAEIRFAGSAEAEDVADTAVRDLAASGRNVYRIPFGGSSTYSARGYADAAGEIIDDMGKVDHVVVAAGSGGTAAGLISVLGPARVLAVDCGAVPDIRSTIAGLLGGMQPRPDFSPDRLRIDGDQVGDGYATLGSSTLAAMRRLASTEGLITDPTYTGRAVAGLVAAVANGSIAPGQTTVFVHTGGLPGLFGHPQLASRLRR
jgi:1-aminocyclopropane-1-carboxylate deaminase/D-cysteine desulfhydrase-like pyridoxal-dependent ACC family enzyme